MIRNPILPGFNPDPSIIKVEDNFYIATSTFEWYPGVQIHHSKDLKNWKLCSRPLNRKALLDLTGVNDSCGVWAPCLSYSNGRYYLIYTIVNRFNGDFKDTHNYLTSCDSIHGQWQEPIYLNSSGFDPSLFHDDDGQKWLLNMVWDHRHGRNRFGGIYLQKFDTEKKSLVGEVKNIFKGTDLGITEAPHLYKRNGYYYLMTAEGGTGYNHAITMARSRKIDGPYEVDPNGYLLTSKDDPDNKLQRCGHGDFVELDNGLVYVVHLSSRPLSGTKRSPMGRETSIQTAAWTSDNWLRLDAKSGDGKPMEFVAQPYEQEQPGEINNSHHKFNMTTLPIEFQWLRTPDIDEIFSLSDNPGFLRLYGRGSIGNQFIQSLVARRQEHFNFECETSIDFEPTNFQQMAGLVNYYNAHKFHYLYISINDKGERILDVMSCLGDQSTSATFPLSVKSNGSENPIVLPKSGTIYLKCQVRGAELVYFWGASQDVWHSVPITLDYSILSDEAGSGEGANFTGAFIGMACQDVSGSKQPADFRYFNYESQ